MKIKIFFLLLVIGFLFNSCMWPSKNIYSTIFVDSKSINRDILLAEKDGLKIYAKIYLPQWEVLSDIKKDSKKFDSIKNSARENCFLIVEIYTNNKGTVNINNYNIQGFQQNNDQSVDSLLFTNFCKRKEWEFQCYKNKKDLMDSIKPIGYDNTYIVSQLLLKQEAPNSKIFDTNKIYVKIKLDLKYNDWNAIVNYQDTLKREDDMKTFALHP